jgi:hypothetical protein
MTRARSRERGNVELVVLDDEPPHGERSSGHEPRRLDVGHGPERRPRAIATPHKLLTTFTRINS